MHKFESAEEYQYQELLEPYFKSKYYQEGVFTFEQKLELITLIRKVDRISIVVILIVGFAILIPLYKLFEGVISIGEDWSAIIYLFIIAISFYIPVKIVSAIADWYIMSHIRELRLQNLEKKLEKNKGE